VTEFAVELFAGPGGMSTGARQAGWRGENVGIEWNPDACATGAAAGHARVCADVSTVPPSTYMGAAGLLASPPCPPWSQSGKRLGPRDGLQVLSRIDAYACGINPSEVEWNDTRSVLCAEPMRWAAVLRPRWIVCEQVPGALPLWRHMAARLTELGYSAVAGVLAAEEFGVPQTRRRAVLVARLDGSAVLPAPTHRRYQPGVPQSAGSPRLLRWVSMHDALGWGIKDRPAWTVTGGGTRTGGAEVFGNARCRARLGGRRPTVEDAAVLQGFPRRYPFQGATQGSRFQQVGDAVPVPLAAAVLRQVVGDACGEVAA